jgi:hypothetical protein
VETSDRELALEGLAAATRAGGEATFRIAVEGRDDALVAGELARALEYHGRFVVRLSAAPDPEATLAVLAAFAPRGDRRYPRARHPGEDGSGAWLQAPPGAIVLVDGPVLGDPAAWDLVVDAAERAAPRIRSARPPAPRPRPS